MPFFSISPVWYQCEILYDSFLGGTSESIWECPRACIRRKAQKCGNRSSHSVRTDFGLLNLLGSYNRTALHLLILMLNHHPYLLATFFLILRYLNKSHIKKAFDLFDFLITGKLLGSLWTMRLEASVKSLQRSELGALVPSGMTWGVLGDWDRTDNTLSKQRSVYDIKNSWML